MERLYPAVIRVFLPRGMEPAVSRSAQHQEVLRGLGRRLREVVALAIWLGSQENTWLDKQTNLKSATTFDWAFFLMSEEMRAIACTLQVDVITAETLLAQGDQRSDYKIELVLQTEVPEANEAVREMIDRWISDKMSGLEVLTPDSRQTPSWQLQFTLNGQLKVHGYPREALDRN